MAAAKVLRVGIHTPIHSLDPLEAEDSVSNLVVAQIYETPYDAPAGEGAAIPVLFAAPLAGDGSGRVYTGQLRSGVVFSDGTPLSAELAVASLRRVPHFKGAVEIAARGNDAVEFRLASPDPRFDLQLTLVHRALTLRKGAAVLGTGAYVPAPGATIAAMRLVRNPRFRGKAAVDEIVFQVFPPTREGRHEALIRAIEAGEVDFTNVLSRTDVSDVKGVRKTFLPANSTCSLYFNVERPELAEAGVRRVLATAIDRRELTELCYTNVLAFAANSLLPTAMGTFRDGMVHDAAKAKALAASTALPRRLRLLITWAPRPYIPSPQPVAERVAAQLQALGVEAQIVAPRDSHDFFGRLERGDYDLVLGGWIAETPDPADFLDANLHSNHVITPEASIAACNLARYRSARMDEALRAYREKRTSDALARIWELQREDAPLVPVMHGPPVIAHAFRVRNVEFNSTGVPRIAAFDLAG